MNRQTFSRRSLRRIATVMMAVVLIISIPSGAVLADTGVDETDPADEVFLDDNGDAVLVYEADSTDDATGELGLDVAESVVYALVTDDMEEDVSAAFSMAVDDDGLESDGSLTADRPAELSDLSMDVSAEQSHETSTFDGSLELEGDASGAGAGITQASASGQTVSSADAFSTDGEFSATMAGSGEGPTIGLDLSITEADGDYTLDVSQQDELSQFETDNWETEADAQQTLENQFSPVASELGGDVTVTIDAHEFQANDDGSGQLDIEYTVELEAVKDELETLVADELATDPELDLGQNDADQLASDFLAAEIDTLEVSYLMSGNTVDGSWDVSLSNLESTTAAAFDLAESVGDMDDGFAYDTEEFVDMYEAQAESGLVETSEWELTYTHDTTQTFSMSISSDAENWDDYTQALEERDVEFAEFSMQADAETVGDEIDMSMHVEMNQDDFLEAAISAMVESLEDDPTADDEVVDFMTAFEDAALEVAKFDLDMDAGTVEMEMGAKFDDFTAFEEHLADAFYGHSVAHIYVDEDAGYVYVTELVDADAAEDDVRALDVVDDETDVHMPGEWDDDHPRLDMQQVIDYLELDPDEEASDEADDSDGSPGFGVAVALVAVLSTLLLLRRN